MKRFIHLIFFTLAFSLPLAAQISFDDIEFEDEELSTSYKIPNKNYVLIKSKRGTGGVGNTPEADLLVSANSKIKEIVLVYTETKDEDYDNREDANRERWENLITTYPQLFQSGTVYRNTCQCVMGGDAEGLKKTQGFYIYVKGAMPSAEVSQQVAISNEQQAISNKQEAISNEQQATPKQETKKSEESHKSEGGNKQEAASNKQEARGNEQEATTKQETKKSEESHKSAVSSQPVETPKQETTKQETKNDDFEPLEEEEEVKVVPKKKPASIRRAKDPKACRPACYGYSDDDILIFYKENMPLTKKEKKKAKNWIANVRIQLNPDGSVKKITVTGADVEFNKRAESVTKNMSKWSAAVKNGVTVKAEVRFTLKYDKSSKAMRPADFIMNPRPTPKCKCVSDSELFDD